MKRTIHDVERIWIDVPYRPVPARNMIRELPHWTIFELVLIPIVMDTRKIV